MTMENQPGPADSLHPEDPAIKCAGTEAYKNMLDTAFFRAYEYQKMGGLQTLKANAPCLESESAAIRLMDKTVKALHPDASATEFSLKPESNSRSGPLPPLTPSLRTVTGPAEVNGETIPAGTTYIQINDLYHPASARNLAKYLTDKDANGTAIMDSSDSFVVDLRDNPGGAYTQLNKMSSVFVGEQYVGKLLAMDLNRKNRMSGLYLDGTAEHQAVADKFKTKNFSVLIGPETHGEAEMLAESLRHYRAATLVGTQSGGKGDTWIKDRVGNAEISVPRGKLFNAIERPVSAPLQPEVFAYPDALSSMNGRDSQLRSALDILKK